MCAARRLRPSRVSAVSSSRRSVPPQSGQGIERARTGITDDDVTSIGRSGAPPASSSASRCRSRTSLRVARSRSRRAVRSRVRFAIATEYDASARLTPRMAIRVFDTMQRSKVDFEPIDPANVRLYVCGPTVYGLLHVGNARPLVAFDVVYRHLKRRFAKVTYVSNVTDVDDKIIKRAAELGEEPQALARR